MNSIIVNVKPFSLQQQVIIETEDGASDFLCYLSEVPYMVAQNVQAHQCNEVNLKGAKNYNAKIADLIRQELSLSYAHADSVNINLI